jgi:hypothetical protein
MRNIIIGSIVAIIISISLTSGISANGPETNPNARLDKLEAQLAYYDDVMATAFDCIREGASGSVDLIACGQRQRAERAELQKEIDRLTAQANFFQRVWSGLRGFLGVSGGGARNVPFVNMPIESPPNYVVTCQKMSVEQMGPNIFDDESGETFFNYFFDHHNQCVDDLIALTERVNSQKKGINDILERVNWILDLFRDIPPIEDHAHNL